jgi:hypothetical protein
LHNKKPKVDYLRTFDCIAHVKKNGPGISKLSDRSISMVFIGYETGTKGYRFCDPIANKLHVSRDVIFEESQAWNWEEKGQTDSGAFIFEVERYSVVEQGAEFEAAADTEFPDQGTPVHG